MRKISAVLCLFLLQNLFFSQKTINFYDYISISNLKNNVSVLANDSLEGRNTGEKGQKKAAIFIVNKLKEYGCQPYKDSYFQPVELISKTKSGSLKINGKELFFLKHFVFNGTYQQKKETLTKLKIKTLSELSTLDGKENYGILIDEYISVDITKLKETFKGSLFFFVKKYNSSYFNRASVKGMSLIDTSKKQVNIFLDYKVLSERIKKELKSEKEIELTIEVDLNARQEKIQTENVHTFIEGIDSLLKKEVVIISAHYDHLGKTGNKIFNGADDNASGSATILEMARIFQQLKNESKGQKRSLLFLWFTGEEHGLLGSEYYANHPLIPLNQTITNLNIDMIGRADSLTEKEKYTVYVIGSNRISLRLHQINEEANKENERLVFDYKYNEEKDPLRLYYRSDHYNFAKKGIPSIFYFGGFHDDYHKETDDVEKINFDKMKEITNLVSKTSFQLLNVELKP